MELTVGASEFKAKCLDLLKRLQSRRLDRVVITHRGKPVAALEPLWIAASASWLEDLQREMAGTVHIPDDIDLTEPIFEGEWDAEKGILYNE